jgi:mRNA interferase MazF
MEMNRGDLISVSLPGDYGKPRPALVIQSDIYRHLNSLTVLPLTRNTLSPEACRVTVQPSEENGLLETSQVMVEKAASLRQSKAGPLIGRLSADDMNAVDRALAIFFGLA